MRRRNAIATSACIAHALNRESKRDRLIPSIFSTGAICGHHGDDIQRCLRRACSPHRRFGLGRQPAEEAIDAAKKELRTIKIPSGNSAAIEQAEALAEARPRERSALV